jgi:hypothetical protein
MQGRDKEGVVARRRVLTELKHVTEITKPMQCRVSSVRRRGSEQRGLVNAVWRCQALNCVW